MAKKDDNSIWVALALAAGGVYLLSSSGSAQAAEPPKADPAQTALATQAAARAAAAAAVPKLVSTGQKKTGKPIRPVPAGSYSGPARDYGVSDVTDDPAYNVRLQESTVLDDPLYNTALGESEVEGLGEDLEGVEEMIRAEDERWDALTPQARAQHAQGQAKQVRSTPGLLQLLRQGYTDGWLYPRSQGWVVSRGPFADLADLEDALAAGEVSQDEAELLAIPLVVGGHVALPKSTSATLDTLFRTQAGSVSAGFAKPLKRMKNLRPLRRLTPLPRRLS